MHVDLYKTDKLKNKKLIFFNFYLFIFLMTQATTTTQTATTRYPYPTVRPRRTNCTAPAIEQFPRPLMGPEARKSGGLIIHIVVAIYTFLGLAIVCDDYFVSSLDRICEGETRLADAESSLSNVIR